LADPGTKHLQKARTRLGFDLHTRLHHRSPRSFVQSQSEVVRAYMAALTEGAKIYREDSRGALGILRKYLRAEDRILESGYKEYDKAISSPPYPGLKGLEAVRESLLDSTPQLKQIDLKNFVDDRFVKSN